MADIQVKEGEERFSDKKNMYTYTYILRSASEKYVPRVDSASKRSQDISWAVQRSADTLHSLGKTPAPSTVISHKSLQRSGIFSISTAAEREWLFVSLFELNFMNK